MHQIFEQYLARLNAKRVEAATYKRVATHLGRWDAWVTESGLDPADVPHQAAQDYFISLGVSPLTMRNHVQAVRSAYRYANALGTVHRDPTALVLIPKQRDREPVTFSNRELRKILKLVENEQEDLIFHVVAYAGLRKSEARVLRWTDIDFEGNQIRVNGKQGKFRLVPIHPILRRLLVQAHQRHADHRYVFQAQKGSIRPVGESWFATVLQRMIERAGIQGKSAHAFRRTVSSVLYEEGVRESYIESILGHAPRTVNARHYRRVLDKDLQTAILALYRSDPIETTPPASLEVVA